MEDLEWDLQHEDDPNRPIAESSEQDAGKRSKDKQETELPRAWRQFYEALRKTLGDA
ncbi:hypothetical protein NDK47_14100 [Brevibacillus ruminantium]|uniref:Uncharacterized protein n=1 Tax=Brevibacillus ruminantium TaxID=2950604 RepID=A0ABY4W812_9BACL|nr:hypothetical protein [Brevibacillus ruminantium]USG63321.1 hypothetical protein NDK47_14100 [Brevibacillus ruminantium]